jgi:hypothetical protein
MCPQNDQANSKKNKRVKNLEENLGEPVIDLEKDSACAKMLSQNWSPLKRHKPSDEV